jgi:hypothetical protein
MTAQRTPLAGERLLGAGSRFFSGVEFLVGAAIVVGHNIFKVVPNEVPILFVLGLVSLRLRDRGWAGFGIGRPRSWLVVIVIAIVAAAVRLGGDEIVIGPIVSQIWPSNETPEDFAAITGHPLVALKWLAIVWTFAAIGEEFGFRGYLVNRAAGALGGSVAAYWAAVAAVAILFGVGHYWNGPAGMIGSGFAGLVFGATYLLSGRNLWACVLAHGLVDTTGIALLYFGVVS